MLAFAHAGSCPRRWRRSAVVVDTRVPYFVTSLAGRGDDCPAPPGRADRRESRADGAGPMVAPLRHRAGSPSPPWPWPSCWRPAMLDAIGTLPSVRAYVGGTDWGTRRASCGASSAPSRSRRSPSSPSTPCLASLRRDWGSTPLIGRAAVVRLRGCDHRRRGAHGRRHGRGFVPCPGRGSPRRWSAPASTAITLVAFVGIRPRGDRRPRGAARTCSWPTPAASRREYAVPGSGQPAAAAAGH